jgi:hypothetical protein
MSTLIFEPQSFMTEREQSTNWAINHLNVEILLFFVFSLTEIDEIIMDSVGRDYVQVVIQPKFSTLTCFYYV